MMICADMHFMMHTATYKLASAVYYVSAMQVPGYHANQSGFLLCDGIVMIF